MALDREPKSIAIAQFSWLITSTPA